MWRGELVEEVSVCGEGCYFGRSFVGQASAVEDAGSEGEVSSIEHELGVGGGCCLDAQVTEHGVGFPAAKQHNSFCADVGTEEGGRAAGAEGARGDLLCEEARVALMQAGGVSESVGHVGGFDGVASSHRRMVIYNGVEGSVRR